MSSSHSQWKTVVTDIWTPVDKIAQRATPVKTIRLYQVPLLISRQFTGHDRIETYFFLNGTPGTPQNWKILVVILNSFFSPLLVTSFGVALSIASGSVSMLHFKLRHIPGLKWGAHTRGGWLGLVTIPALFHNYTSPIYVCGQRNKLTV